MSYLELNSQINASVPYHATLREMHPRNFYSEIVTCMKVTLVTHTGPISIL